MGYRWVTVIILVGVIADRWLKSLALTGHTAQWWIVRFVLFKNNALVFSWPLSNTVATVLLIFGAVVVCVLGSRAWKKGDQLRVLATLLMLLGALSNLYDRIFFGYVVDWAYLGRWWPVFNLADVMIAVGLILFIWPRSRLTNSVR